MASSTVSWAILSTAEITGKTLPSLKKCEDSRVMLVASRDKSKAEDYAKMNELEKVVTYEEMYNAECLQSFNAVYCPVSTKHRNSILAKVAASGKHIYSEKPLGGTPAELKELLDSCAANKVQWMDGTMWYHSVRTKEIEKLLRSQELGPVKQVHASFSFAWYSLADESWLQGGNGRTDKNREPMGCFGDQGWYPCSAILWAYDFELPEKVMMTYCNKNKVDTIVSSGGTIWFKGGRIATFDCGVEAPHRSQYEIVCERGVIKVDDLVGGQGRSGDFGAYSSPFVGSSQYVVGDVMGRDEVRSAAECDHVDCKVNDFVDCVRRIRDGGDPDPEWPRRSLAVHTMMCALFESAETGSSIIYL
jgi:predicted dehydrogenase